MSENDEDQRTSAERVDELRIEYEEELRSVDESGEALNVILSDGVREALEAYLKGSAEVIIEASNPPLVTDMVVQTAARPLPHVTKGCVREALIEYSQSYESEEHLGTMRRESNNDGN